MVFIVHSQRGDLTSALCVDVLGRETGEAVD